jgi:redox-sensitive bicupin YhaK (pirin superfamily)
MEGAGVLIRRTVGTPALPNLDPFLMLDHISSSVAAASKGFPTHPHRGQTTVSIMLRGGMEHRDSMGNKGVVSDGGVQVMRAGNGVEHSEFPTASRVEGGNEDDDEPEIHGFQLWVNLPSKQKYQPPAYQDVQAEEIPTVALPPSVGGGGGASAATARVIAGRLLQQHQQQEDSATNAASSPTFVQGPARIAPPQVLLLDVTVPAGATARVPVDDSFAGFLYLYQSGQGAKLSGVSAPARHALVLSKPETTAASTSTPSFSDVEAEAGADAALKFLLVAGKPIGEPIVQHGPFVMNTRAEIEQAFREYSEGTFIKQGKDFDPFAVAAAGRDEL